MSVQTHFSLLPYFFNMTSQRSAMKYLKFYAPFTLIVTICICLFVDSPTTELNKYVLINTFDNVKGVGETRAKLVYNELVASDIVIMKTSDCNYNRRKCMGLILIMLTVSYVLHREVLKNRKDIYITASDTQMLIMEDKAKRVHACE